MADYQPLQLTISNGIPFISNKKAVVLEVAELVAKYQSYLVTPETLTDDKAVLAKVRKRYKEYEAVRIKKKEEMTKPIETMEKELVSVYGPLEDVIEHLDAGVKEVEEQIKTLRLLTVRDYLRSESEKNELDHRLVDGLAENYLKAEYFRKDRLTMKDDTKNSLSELVKKEVAIQDKKFTERTKLTTMCLDRGMAPEPYVRLLDKGEHTFDDLVGMIEFDSKVKPAEEGEEVIYKERMTMELFFKDESEKERFKQGMARLGFHVGVNYFAVGYRALGQPLTQEQVNQLFPKK